MKPPTLEPDDEWEKEDPGPEMSLGYKVAQWIEENLVIPDGPFALEPFKLSTWQLRFLVKFYELKPTAKRDLRKPSQAFVNERGGQLIMPKKTGKGPFAAAWAVAEACGPVLFDHWDDKGLACGRPWPTPWVEITAATEDQAANVWRALIAMIQDGPINADIPDSGETRINLPGRGLIKPVTASPKSRTGGRATAAVQDESQTWNRRNGGRALADAQRMNLAGMGGRFLETGNAWDPNAQSVAEDTWKHGKGVYKKMVQPPPGKITNHKTRMKALAKVYDGSPWVDLDRVSLEMDELIAQGDPAKAERDFINRIVPGEDNAVTAKDWQACKVALWDPAVDKTCDAHPRENAFHERGCGRALITIGVDGARYQDALAIIATDVPTGYQWPLGIWERPPDATEDYEHPEGEVDGIMTEAFERFNVYRAYVDPGSQTGNISHLTEKWQGRWGEKRVYAWLMSRPRATGMMVRNYVAGIIAHDVSHPDDEVFTRHVLNARRRLVAVRDEDGAQLWVAAKEFPGSPLKIDAFAAGALSWEARGDAIAAGTMQSQGSAYEAGDVLCYCQARQPIPHWRQTSCTFVPGQA